MKVVWRDGADQEILSESFPIKVKDISGQESACKDFTVTKQAETRDFLFAMDAWKLYEDTTMPGMEYEMRQ